MHTNDKNITCAIVVTRCDCCSWWRRWEFLRKLHYQTIPSQLQPTSTLPLLYVVCMPRTWCDVLYPVRAAKFRRCQCSPRKNVGVIYCMQWAFYKATVMNRWHVTINFYTDLISRLNTVNVAGCHNISRSNDSRKYIWIDIDTTVYSCISYFKTSIYYIFSNRHIFIQSTTYNNILYSMLVSNYGAFSTFQIFLYIQFHFQLNYTAPINILQVVYNNCFSTIKC